VRCGKPGRGRRPISAARGNVAKHVGSRKRAAGFPLPSFRDSPFLCPVFAIIIITGTCFKFNTPVIFREPLYYRGPNAAKKLLKSCPLWVHLNWRHGVEVAAKWALISNLRLFRPIRGTYLTARI
jgi:hypothetical protein